MEKCYVLAMENKPSISAFWADAVRQRAVSCCVRALRGLSRHSSLILIAPLHLVIALVTMPVLASADEKECGREEAYAAESVTDYLNSWENVYTFFIQFRHCYDGAIAEGAEDKMQVLWATRWTDLPAMIDLTNNDLEFKKFVWSVVHSEAFPQDTFQKVLHNATSVYDT